MKHKLFTCQCGNKTNKLRYDQGKQVCDKCSPQNLGNIFLRRLEGEKQYYAKDILQKINKDGTINKDYEEAYGKKAH